MNPFKKHDLILGKGSLYWIILYKIAIPSQPLNNSHQKYRWKGLISHLTHACIKHH